ERGGVKVDIAGPRPILLHEAVNLAESRWLLFFAEVAEAEHHDQPSHNDSDDRYYRYQRPSKFHARPPTGPVRPAISRISVATDRSRFSRTERRRAAGTFRQNCQNGSPAVAPINMPPSAQRPGIPQ